MVKAICNNPDCRYAHSKKVFEVEDLSSECPSCGQKNLLPEIASKYIDPDKHKKDSHLREMKSKIERSHGDKDGGLAKKKRQRSLKNIEMSYRKKMDDLEKVMKSNKLSKKFKEIDSDISEGDLELKDVKYELEKVDSLFKSFNDEDVKASDASVSENRSSSEKKSKRKKSGPSRKKISPPKGATSKRSNSNTKD